MKLTVLLNELLLKELMLPVGCWYFDDVCAIGYNLNSFLCEGRGIVCSENMTSLGAWGNLYDLRGGCNL